MNLFFFIINIEKSCAAQYFCGNCLTFFQASLMNRMFSVEKNSIYFK